MGSLGSKAGAMREVPGLGILVVLATARRRGAETEGLGLADALRSGHGALTDVVALAPGGTDPLPVEVLGSARSPIALRALRRRARSVDVVVAFGSTALPASALALAGTSRRFVYRSIGDPSHWVRNELHRVRTGLLMRRSVHVVALWPGARQQLIDLYHVDPDRTSVIPNGRSASRFDIPNPTERRHARSQLGVNDSARVVVYLGALTVEKRIERAMTAVAAVDGATLVIAGEGPERATLEAAARRIPRLNVQFLGQVREPISLLHAADALVLTSRTEGMPGAALEALLCGVPVVAPDVGGMRDLVDDGISGRLTDGSVEQTGAALDAVMQPTSLHGSALRMRVRARFGLDVVSAQWAHLLTAVAR